MRGSRRKIGEEQGGQIAIRARMGRARGVAFPLHFAEHVTAKEGVSGTVQLTFYYIPILDEIYNAMAPDVEELAEPVEVEACVTAQVVMPKAAFEAWFEDLARKRGLLPALG